MALLKRVVSMKANMMMVRPNSSSMMKRTATLALGMSTAAVRAVANTVITSTIAAYTRNQDSLV